MKLAGVNQLGIKKGLFLSDKFTSYKVKHREKWGVYCN